MLCPTDLSRFGPTPDILGAAVVASGRDTNRVVAAHLPPTEPRGRSVTLKGELRIEQEGKTFTAKKNFVWTRNKDTKEQAYNDGNAVAIMRITDLKA